MMAGNIAVFGGNGLTGSEVVYQALQRGDEVTAFCRDPSKLVVCGPCMHDACIDFRGVVAWDKTFLRAIGKSLQQYHVTRCEDW